MKKSSFYIIFVTVIAAIGGLLFGFDTAIVAGATRYLKDQFALTSIQEGWAISVVLIGCMFGAGISGTISDRIGRKRFMLVSAVLFLVSAVGCALPRTITEFVVFRFIGGLGIGSASILAPLYISEIAPARIRGALVSVNQMAIVTGILLAYFVNWAFAGVGPSNWRWMYAAGALPSVIFFLLLLRIPESPRWLVKQGRESEALGVLSRVNSADLAAAEVSSIKETLATKKGSLAELFRPGFRRALLIAVVLAILQQITGINAVLYYAPRIFERAGFTRMSAIGQSTIVGFVNMLFTIVAIVLVDRIGRKPLLLTAAGGMGVSLLLLGAAFRSQAFSGPLILGLILLYIAFFAMAMGPTASTNPRLFGSTPRCAPSTSSSCSSSCPRPREKRSRRSKSAGSKNAEKFSRSLTRKEMRFSYVWCWLGAWTGWTERTLRLKMSELAQENTDAAIS